MEQEYPACGSGLSRTQRQALEIIRAGESRPGRVFGQSQDREESCFMGDSTFWNYLRQMLQSNPPLLQLPAGKTLTLPTDPSQALSITPAGIEVLEGRRNWLSCHVVDRWFGGVHLSRDNPWCWDNVTKRLMQQNA